MTAALSPCAKAAIGRDVSRQRVNARAAVAQAIKSGRLKRPDSCSRCGRDCKPEAHHADYADALSVEFLCRRCHRIADREDGHSRFKSGAPRTEGAVKARQWRESRGMTQQQVADRAAAETGKPVSRSLINEIEAGRTGARLYLAEFYWTESSGFVDFPSWNRPVDGGTEKGAAA